MILSEGSTLVLFIPATSRALVFRVMSVYSSGVIDFGPLPIPAGVSLPTYRGTLVSTPADGVMPGYAFIPVGAELSFPMPGVWDATDMWYVPSEGYNDRLFHVILDVTPAWLRVDVTIPRGVVQGKFQKEKITTGVDRAFGFSRGSIEVVHIPGVRVGYRFGNDTNLDVRTYARFKYGEYIVETPRDPDFIFSILSRRVKPDRWVTLPVTSYESRLRTALIDNYGYEGFPLYAVYERQRALQEIQEALRGVKV